MCNSLLRNRPWWITCTSESRFIIRKWDAVQVRLDRQQLKKGEAIGPAHAPFFPVDVPEVPSDAQYIAFSGGPPGGQQVGKR